ncbi:MAG: hypothetical protein FJX46_16445, partial [Alphaproteobacteria bacterium]|nr:hypothetical protein [Alphaproteobacteria bacterium]
MARQASASPSVEIVATAAETGRVIVPGGAFLVGAEFQRNGSDLVLVGADGTRVVVPEYFSATAPAELVSDTGLRVDGDLAARLAGPVAPGQYAQAGGAVARGDPIGRVEKASGAVNVVHADGSTGQLRIGDPVYQGDIVATGQGGSVGLMFADKTTFSLGAGARMALDQLVFDPASGRGNLGLSVLQGAFLFVSGEIAKANPDGMVIKTPVATIGIRGTAAASTTGPEGSQSSFALVRDPGGSLGQITVINGSGALTISGENQSTTLSSFYVPPSPPVTLARIELVATVASALSALPAQPALFVQSGGQPPPPSTPSAPGPAGAPAAPGVAAAGV